MDISKVLYQTLEQYTPNFFHTKSAKNTEKPDWNAQNDTVSQPTSSRESIFSLKAAAKINSYPFHSWAQKVHSPNLLKRKCISGVARICIIIIFHLSKLWKATFSLLCYVIFLVRLQEKFDIDHSQEWKGYTVKQLLLSNQYKTPAESEPLQVLHKPRHNDLRSVGKWHWISTLLFPNSSQVVAKRYRTPAQL